MDDDIADDAARKQQELLWTTALEKLGRENVRIQLGQMLPDRSATFKLPNQPGCKRGFAADWLAREDAAEKALAAAEEVRATRAEATETRRHRQNLAVAIVLCVLGIVAAMGIAWWFR